MQPEQKNKQPEQPMKIFCKANTSLNAACRGDKVILVPDNPSDASQHWFQDYSAVGNLTDDKGSRAFALVNKTTGQALVNGNWEGELQLAPYNGLVAVDLSMLWSLGEQRADGFSEVRVLHDMYYYSEGTRALTHRYYTLNAMGGSPVEEGNVVGIYRPQESDHAYWKIVPVAPTTRTAEELERSSFC